MGNIPLIIGVLNAPLVLISVIGNSLLLVAILRTPSLRSPSTIFLCSVAVSDLLVGFVVQPVFVASIFNLESLTLRWCFSRYNDGNKCGSVFGSSLSLAISEFNDRKTCRICNSNPLVYFSLFVMLLYLAPKHFFLYYCRLLIALCISVCTFSYIKIYQIVRHHQIQIHFQQQALENLNTEDRLSILRSKKSAINTFIYYICMILCYCPGFVASLTLTIFPNLWTVAWNLADTVVFLNSSINPYLYW